MNLAPRGRRQIPRKAALIVGKDAFQARNVLAATRALGLAGWRVAIGSPVPGLASRSRWASRWHHVPSPAQDFETFVAATNRAIRAGRYDVVFAAGDAELLALSLAMDRIDSCVPHPPAPVTLRALDKLHLAAAAEGVGMAVPRTREATADELAEVRGPVLVKARLHWQPGAQRVPDRLNALRVHGGEAAKARTVEITKAGGQAVLQEVIGGRHTAYVALLDEQHEVVVSHQQDGYGTWPARDGVWTRAEIVAPRADIDVQSAAVLRELRWTGLVQLQFLVGADDRPRLIDLNGRFYASIGLALAAGVNLPALSAALALGERPARTEPARAGLRYQWLEGDLLRALEDRRGGLLADVADTLRYARGAVPSLWRRDDPAPVLAWLGSLAPRVTDRGLVRRGRPA